MELETMKVAMLCSRCGLHYATLDISYDESVPPIQKVGACGKCADRERELLNLTGRREPAVQPLSSSPPWWARVAVGLALLLQAVAVGVGLLLLRRPR